MENLTIGCRFVSDGHYGTVKFIGEVPPTTGQWLGVEWDEPDRGKHDGMHEGHRYFKTSHPSSGSFIREKKAEFGISYLEALIDRYGIPDDEDVGIEKSEWYINTYGDRQKPVEMVGALSVAKKQSQFGKLTEVALREMKISSAGEGNIIEKTSPNVTDLDLSKNLLASWEEVGNITKQMKSIDTLKLSENRLPLPLQSTLLTKAFHSVSELFLNYMKLKWEDVVQLSPMLPNLKNLHVCFNEISSIARPENIFESLELLNLESNNISDWQSVKHLGHLPRLTTLIVNVNSVPKISFEETACGEKTKLFSTLKSISLNDNQLSTWRDVNELDKLQSLEEIKLKRNPLLKDVKYFIVRQLLIAKVGGLTQCNGSEVPDIERKTAELDYLKKYGQEWLDSGGSRDVARNRPNAEFRTNHPRYHTFLELYGAPEDSELSAAPSTALKSALIKVTITCPQKPEIKDVSKKLPGSMTVQKVKYLISRIFKVDTTEQQLAYISKKMEGPEVELDNDMRQLSYYSVENEDTIVVKF